ncbi:MAG: acetyl-coenzyme A synthetase N-terminal domain-containing protein, partial [Ignavibacteriaceae bacterium]
MPAKKLSGDVYHPTEEVINHANAKCDELYNFAERDYEGFWAKEAEELHWFQKWNKVLD